MSEVNVRTMLEAGVHFGHQTKRWNPKMKPFIFGARNGIYIIDLQQSLSLYQRAYNYVVNLTSRGQKILFVGTKYQAYEILKNQAIRGGQYYVNHRWLGGTMTNFVTIKQSINRLKTIEKMLEENIAEKLTKKELLSLTREQAALERNLGGIKDMVKLPAALFVIDPVKEHISVSEAQKLGIQVIAIVDTNCDPEIIDYPVPGNDDSTRSIDLLTSGIADACIEGNAIYEEKYKALAEATEKTKPEKTEKGPRIERVSRNLKVPAKEPSSQVADDVGEETGSNESASSTNPASAYHLQ